MKAYASAIIPADANRVWNIVRRFDELDRWHEAVVDCAMDDGEPADRVGAVRTFHLADGSVVKERLLALDDADMTLVYSFVIPAFPIDNYVATMHVAAVTATNESFIEWTATFDQRPDSREDYAAIIASGIFAAGFEGIARHVGA